MAAEALCVGLLPCETSSMKLISWSVLNFHNCQLFLRDISECWNWESCFDSRALISYKENPCSQLSSMSSAPTRKQQPCFPRKLLVSKCCLLSETCKSQDKQTEVFHLSCDDPYRGQRRVSSPGLGDSTTCQGAAPNTSCNL